MRILTATFAALSALTLAACGSDVEEPVEQIVVAEPGEAASYPKPDQTPEADTPEQAAE
ncbi:MAG: hypothetical protein AAGL68_00615 [Pseudomonadota bacterium]